MDQIPRITDVVPTFITDQKQDVAQIQTFQQYKNSRIKNAVPLTDGRVVLLIEDQLFLWIPTKQTLEYFENVPPLNWIHYHEGNTILTCWNNRLIIVHANTKKHFVYESLSDDDEELVVCFMLRKNETVAFITDNGNFHVWDPVSNNHLVKTLPGLNKKIIKQTNTKIIEAFEKDRFIVVIKDECVIDFKL